jgi:hypothetical protein
LKGWKVEPRLLKKRRKLKGEGWKLEPPGVFWKCGL